MRYCTSYLKYRVLREILNKSDMTNLQKQINNLNETLVTQLPQEVLIAFSDSIADLKRQKIEDKAIEKGARIQPFTLKSSKGIDVSSESLLSGNDKLVIAFFRGTWCPYCNLELKALQDSLSHIENKKAKLIAISPQMPEYSSAMSESNGLSFDILFDENNVLATQLGITFPLQDFVLPHYQQLGIDITSFNGNANNELPMPAVFVVDGNHTITYRFADANYMNRVDIDELITNL